MLISVIMIKKLHLYKYKSIIYHDMTFDKALTYHKSFDHENNYDQCHIDGQIIMFRDIIIVTFVQPGKSLMAAKDDLRTFLAEVLKRTLYVYIKFYYIWTQLPLCMCYV